MIGGLSSFSPGSIGSYGSTGAPPIATAQSAANDGTAVCTALDCKTHGAALRAQLQASFPGLRLPGEGGASAEERRREAGTITARPVGGATGGALASGLTLFTAQEQGSAGGSGSSGGAPKAAGELSEEEKQQVAKLKQTDAKVRAHERAHAAVGGQYAGAPSYEYVRGPDGQMYAVGGEVAIDISPENDPEATLQKAAQVAAAALAPADPSGADRAVAAAAAQLRLQALAQIREEKRAETEQQAIEREVERAEAAARQAASGQAEPGQAESGQAEPGQPEAGQVASGQPAAPSGGGGGEAAAAAAARAARAYRGLTASVGQAVGLSA